MWGTQVAAAAAIDAFPVNVRELSITHSGPVISSHDTPVDYSNPFETY